MRSRRCVFLLGVVLAMVMVFAFGVQSAMALTSTDGNWEFNDIGGGNAELFAYTGTATDLAIPDSVTDAAAPGNTYTVTVLGNDLLNVQSTGISLDTITHMPSSLKLIGERVFQDNQLVPSIDIPSGVTSIGSSAFINCQGLTSITIPNGVPTISDSLFQNCSGLESLVIPPDVTSVGNNSFNGCTALSSISIPNKVTLIGTSAFAGCASMTSMTLGTSVQSIGVSAFQLCSGLTSVTIPNSVTIINNNAFRGCTGLTQVTIGTGVTTIGTYAFAGSSTPYKLPNLKAAYFMGLAPTSMGGDGTTIFGSNTGPTGFKVYYFAGNGGGTWGFERFALPPGPWPTSGRYATDYTPNILGVVTGAGSILPGAQVDLWKV
ncbi:MAG: leucine-rich repeat domain-containing protein, partial [Coriobacteriia bacterium]